MSEVQTAALLFAEEVFSEALVDEIKPLAETNFAETGFFDDIRFNPDYLFYRRAHEAKILRVFTARRDGKLLGYSTYLIHEHPHYVGSKHALHDIIFLAPELRQGANGYRFMKYCDARLQESGLDAIIFGYNVKVNLSSILERMGYTLVQKSYARRIHHGS